MIALRAKRRHGRRAAAMLMLAIVLVGSLFAASPARRAAALTNWGLQAQGFEYRPYRGATYEAYVDTSNNSVIVKRCVRNAGCVQKNLGGITYANVRLDADVDQNYLVVAARGNDNGLYVRVLRGDPNLSASDFGFDGWKNLGGILTGAPLVTGTRGAVMVTVPGSDGNHYTRITTDGINFGDNTSGWLGDRTGVKTGSSSLGNDGRFDFVLDSLSHMKAGVYRVPARFDDPSNCHLGSPVTHDVTMLDQIINWGGVRTIIIRTGEHCTDYDSVENLLRYSPIYGDASGQNIQNFIFNRQNILFYIEIGNEPDVHGRCTVGYANQARDTVNRLRSEYEYSHPNMKFMLSLPTQYASDQCWSDFASGSSGAKYEAVAPHLYTPSYFAGNYGRGINKAQDLWPGVPMYITETNVDANAAGLNDNWYEVANRIRLGEDQVMWFRDGSTYPNRNGLVRGYTIFIQHRDVTWCNSAAEQYKNYAFDYTKGSTSCEPRNFSGSDRLGQGR